MGGISSCAAQKEVQGENKTEKKLTVCIISLTFPQQKQNFGKSQIHPRELVLE